MRRPTGRIRPAVLALVGVVLSQTELAPQSPARMPPALQTRQYALISTKGDFFLRKVSSPNKKIIPIPRSWLVSPEDEQEEEGNFVSSFTYHEHVTSFDLGDGRIGMHVSSYDIQKDGSAHAAAGRDVFLVLEPGSGRLHAGLINLGITKARERSGGCFAASHSSFLLSDINGDELLDIGVAREELRCQEVGQNSVERPFYEQDPIRWYVLNRSEWKYDKGLDRRFPAGRYLELPLIGIATSPVDYVKHITRRD